MNKTAVDSGGDGKGGEEELPSITSDFPLPPSYYLNYGPDGSNPPPPNPPLDGTFVVFGDERLLNEQTPALEAQGLTTLYDPKSNLKQELKKLVRGSMKRFAVLLQSLSKDYDQEKINEQFQDLDVCFINMLYIVNEMRALQGKAELKNLLADQVKAKREAVALLKDVTKKAGEDIQRAFAVQNGTDVVMQSNLSRAPAAEKVDEIVAVVDEEFLKISSTADVEMSL